MGELLPAGVHRREMAEDGELESHGDEPPPGFRPGPAAWLVHPPCEEGGRLERHGVTRASASNGARHACPDRLPKCRTTDSNRDPPRPKRGASTGWASSACTTTSLLGESNPGCLRTEEACLPLPLSRRKCVGMIPGVLGGSRTRNRRLLKPPSLPRLEYEHGEPPPGADPGRPLYESGAAAVRGGMASGAGLEPAGRGSGPRWGRLRPTRKRCGRRDSNAQTARSELARSTNCRHSRVRRPGIEPGIPRLRVECFTDIARGACDAV